MKYYRILTTNKETKRQVWSPFVFEEDEALWRCKISNITCRKGKHLPILVKKPRKADIYNPEIHKLMGPSEIDMNVERLEMTNKRLGRAI